MAEQHTSRNPQPAMPPAGQPVRADVQRTEGAQYRALVRYYKQMRVNRTYRLRVQLPRVAHARPAARLASGNVRVRPVVPGALVQPAEIDLDTSKPDSVAEFRVTPAAVGKLRQAHVELYHHDRLVQEIPLKMKGTRQTLTCFLACLTILVPLLLVPVFGRDAWLRSTGLARAKMQESEGKKLNLTRRAAPGAGRGAARQGGGGPPAVTRSTDDLWNAFFGDQNAARPANAEARGREAAGRAPMAGAGRGRGMAAGRRGGAGPGRGARGANAPQPPEPEEPSEEAVQAEQRAKERADVDASLHGTIERTLFHVEPTWIPLPVSKFVAVHAQDGYDKVAVVAGVAEMPFDLALALLVLTLGSWIIHASYKGRRYGKPITLGA